MDGKFGEEVGKDLAGLGLVEGIPSGRTRTHRVS